MIARFDAPSIRRYYDRHTARFVALGQQGSLGSIHRAVWAPGVSTPQQAFRYVEEAIIALLRDLPPAFERSHVVDLGCGVGASLSYLADRLPIHGTGVTLSENQARLATERIRRAAHSDRIRCLVGDYCDLPPDVGGADLAFAIESFVHGPDPDRFFAQCRELVRPGGLLLICDDFRRDAAGREVDRTIERFRTGWYVNTLLTSSDLQARARHAGFEHRQTTDLSSYLQLGRPRDRMIDALVALIGWLPIETTRLGYLAGGSALQKALAQGWIGYDLALFQRSEGSAT
jgi:SAM-dependent methyltransferase